MMKMITERRKLSRVVRRGPGSGVVTVLLAEAPAIISLEYGPSGNATCIKILSRSRSSEWDHVFDLLTPSYDLLRPETATWRPFRWRDYMSGNLQSRRDVKRRLGALGFDSAIVDGAFPQTMGERNDLRGVMRRNRKFLGSCVKKMKPPKIGAEQKGKEAE